MHVFNAFRQVIDTASAVKEITDHKKTYVFNVDTPVTFYLQAEYADVVLTRWHEPRIEFQVNLQMAPGWRIATEQDELGVYVVAHRRKVVGGLSTARFDVRVPVDTHIALKLVESQVRLGRVNGELEITPAEDGHSMTRITSRTSLSTTKMNEK